MPRFLFLFCVLLSVLPVSAQSTGGKSPEIVVAEAMEKFLPGFKFNKRLAIGEQLDHVLLFQKDADILIVGWTEGPNGTVAIPANRMVFDLYDSNGNSMGQTQVANNAVYLPLTKSPVFLVPTARNPLLEIAAAASRVPPSIQVKGPAVVPLSMSFTNVLDEPFLLSLDGGTKMQALKPGQTYTINKELDVGRQAEPFPVVIGANGFDQRIIVNVMNPIGISLSPDVGGALVLNFLNPSGEAFRAKAELRLMSDPPADPLKFDVAMSRGEKTMDYQIPLASDQDIPYAMQVVLLETLGEGMEKRRIVLAESPLTQFLSAGNFNAVNDNGNLTEYQAKATAGSTLSMSAGAPEEGLPTVRKGGMKLLYQFKQAGGAVAVNPLADGFRIIEAKPVALGMWVYGDGSGLIPSVVILDSQGRKVICRGEPITWQGWNYVRFELNQPMVGPLLLDSLFQIENNAHPSYGQLYLNDPTWIYEVNRPALAE
ncbi:hypothetical protein H5P28_06845 [Ruficoccus amylovorans]|uniref:Uncharacterized protein n=1 Tax=Ruficoccus amylovorans TaxID=1804625 RepID=A0A842HE89_9BACT|nr:hypothetical protein [Ruficoccus amylovorans]MBC2593976.1 hypothetical protein [Ruficoccus amylovorans]